MSIKGLPALPDIDFDSDLVKRIRKEWEKAFPIAKCECGSEKCGSPYHSDWCPKHKKR